MPRSAFAALVVLFSSLSFSQSTKPAAPPQTPRQAILEVITAKDPTSALQRHLPEATKKYWAGHLKDVPSIFSFGAGMAMASTITADSSSAGFEIPNAARPGSESAANFETFNAGPVLFRARDAQSGTIAELRIDGDDFRGDEDVMDLSLNLKGENTEQTFPIPMQLPSFRVDMKLEGGVWRFNEVDFTEKMRLGDPAFVQQTERQQAELAGLVVQDALRTVVAAESGYLQRTGGRGYTCSLADLAPADKNSDKDKMWSATLQFAEEKGYKLQFTDCSATGFHVAAVPQESGQATLCADQSGIIKRSKKSATDCFAAGQPVTEEDLYESSPR